MANPTGMMMDIIKLSFLIKGVYLLWFQPID